MSLSTFHTPPSRYDCRNCVLCRMEGVFPEDTNSGETLSFQLELMKGAMEEEREFGWVALYSKPVAPLPLWETSANAVPGITGEGNPREPRPIGTCKYVVLDGLRRELGLRVQSGEGVDGVRVWVAEAVQTPTPTNSSTQTSPRGSPTQRLMTIAEETEEIAV